MTTSKQTQLSMLRARSRRSSFGAHPDDAGALCVLGLIDAALGRKEEALREGRRAVELLPIEKDASDGPRVIVCFAMIVAWVGDNNLACDQLVNAMRHPTLRRMASSSCCHFGTRCAAIRASKKSSPP